VTTSSRDEARRVLRLEADAVRALADRVGEAFDRAVELVLACRGRVVVTGMGKSGIIGRKLAATLASVGSPSVFVHPAEGGHGDIGMVARGDCAIALSRSGETAEILAILPALKRLGIPLVALTGRPGSTLAREADVVLDVSVSEEACEMDLVPTTSTTAALAMGDALAIAVLKRRGLTAEDYAQFHPAGSLGRRLLLRVSDIMRRGADIASVRAGAPLQEAILEMTAKRVGATFVTDEDGRLLGVMTDHDLRRTLSAGDADLRSLTVDHAMTRAPLTIQPGALVAEAIRLTETRSVSVLPVVDADGRVVGLVHLHDLLRSGVA
jgi:arabinose-5-phosphate isomerase